MRAEAIYLGGELGLGLGRFGDFLKAEVGGGEVLDEFELGVEVVL